MPTDTAPFAAAGVPRIPACIPPTGTSVSTWGFEVGPEKYWTALQRRGGLYTDYHVSSVQRVGVPGPPGIGSVERRRGHWAWGRTEREVRRDQG